jgi:hypothetical protein
LRCGDDLVAVGTLSVSNDLRGMGRLGGGDGDVPPEGGADGWDERDNRD